MDSDTGERRNLADIVTAYLDTLIDSDGVDLDLTAELDAAAEPMVEKFRACIAVHESLTGRAVVEKERAKRIGAHARALDNNADRLLEWMAHNFMRTGLDRLDVGTAEIRLMKKPPSVRLNEPEFMAYAAAERDDLLRWKDPEPDKKAILAALKDGEVIPGAALVTDGKRLTW